MYALAALYVPVDLHGDAGVAMAERFARSLDVGSCIDHQAGGRVPQVIDTNTRQASLLAETPKAPLRVAVIDRRAGSVGSC